MPSALSIMRLWENASPKSAVFSTRGILSILVAVLRTAMVIVKATMKQTGMTDIPRIRGGP